MAPEKSTEKYERVKKTRDDVVKDDSEIRVTAQNNVSAYVSRASTVFNELGRSSVTITATGNALTKAVTAAEVIKRRFKGLHQVNKLINQEIEDEWRPLEEGLDPVKEVRNVAAMEIILSKEPLDKDDRGYQEPIDQSLVKEIDPEEAAERKGNKGKGKSKDKSSGKGKSKGKKGGYEDDYDSFSRDRKGDKGKGYGKGYGKAWRDEGYSRSYDDYGYGGDRYDRSYGKSYGKGDGYGYSSNKGYGGGKGYDRGYDSKGYKGDYDNKGYKGYGKSSKGDRRY